MTEPGAPARPLGEEEARRVRAPPPGPRSPHLEDADLVGGAEAVLDRAEDAVGVVPLALEVEDGVHQVLEHPRARRCAPSLVTCPTRKVAIPARLGQRHEPRRRTRGPGSRCPGADSSSGRNMVWMESTTRHPRAASWRPRAPRSREIGLGQEVERAGRDAQPVGAHLDLARPTPRPRRRAPGPRARRGVRLAARRRVDLPMPGSPPISTSEPVTTPPPRTRSSSPMPVATRSPASTRMLAERLGPRAPAQGGPRDRARAPLLDERQVLAPPRAVGAGAGLGRGEAALLAAIDVALARHHCFSGRGWIGVAGIDGRADQRPQQEAPLRALEECDEVLVHGRVLEEPAHRALARLEPVGDDAQVGHRGAEVGGGVAHRPVARRRLRSPPSRPCPRATRSETSRRLCATARRSSATVLYCGSRSRAAASPSSRGPWPSRPPGRASPWRPGARGPTRRCPARAARPPRCRSAGRGPAGAWAAARIALSRRERLRLVVDSGRGASPCPSPPPRRPVGRGLARWRRGPPLTPLCVQLLQRSPARLVGEPVDGRRASPPRPKIRSISTRSSRREHVAGLERGRLRRAEGDLDELVAEEPLGRRSGPRSPRGSAPRSAGRS